MPNSTTTQSTSQDQNPVNQQPFTLSELPYDYNVLEPIISAETLKFHHDKHHAAYVKKLNELLPGSGFEKSSLSEIIMNAEGPLFNNAAQHWNHDFYWKSMSGDKDEKVLNPSLKKVIEDEFVSLEQFKKEFEGRALSQFGSGWAWLVLNERNKLEILTTSNADNPLRRNLIPLFTCDVWEHAYYIDYRNDRAKYLSRFWEVLNWKFVEENFSRCQQ